MQPVGNNFQTQSALAPAWHGPPLSARVPAATEPRLPSSPAPARGSGAFYWRADRGHGLDRLDWTACNKAEKAVPYLRRPRSAPLAQKAKDEAALEGGLRFCPRAIWLAPSAQL